MAAIQGLDKLRIKLARLPKEVQAALIQANLKSADEMVALARRLAPRGETLRLVDSIQRRVQKGGIVQVKAGGRETSVPLRKGSGVLFDYALAIEFGRKASRRRAQGRRGGRPRFAGPAGAAAQPFFWPSWRAIKPVARRRANRAMRLAIRAIGGR